jgi:hypothetical protein
MSSTSTNPVSASANDAAAFEPTVSSAPAGHARVMAPAAYNATAGGEAEVYRSVSRAAILSCLLAVFGLVSFTTPWLLPIPFAGLVAAWVAFAGFRRYPEELVGKPLATAGAAFCAFTLVGAPAWHGYVYATEVPEGYRRVSFDSLMTGKGEPEQPTAKAIELDGQQVFIKGYIHPSSMDSMMSKRFVIVPDLGTCCFGGQPPLTHMIEVTLSGEQYARKSYRKQRLAGTLYVNRQLKPVEDLTGVYYTLRADILK